MKVLIVLGHPERGAFGRALAESFAEEVMRAGHEATLADLHGEEFDPRMMPEDLAYYRGTGSLPADVAREQRRVDAADALVLVFPVYWWSMPALMKGWIDRVFTGGWAYEIDGDGKARGRLADRPVLLLMTAGADAGSFARHGYDEAIATQIEKGIFGYCGIRGVRSVIFHDVEASDAEVRRNHLSSVREHAASVLRPGAGQAG